MKRVNLGVWKLFTRHNYSGVNALARRALSRDHGRKENKYRTDWREVSELSSIQYFFFCLTLSQNGRDVFSDNALPHIDIQFFLYFCRAMNDVV